jgi:hypothetical protein
VLQNSRTPENLMKALNSGHVAWEVPNWQATANGATVDAAEFFDLSHDVWSTCSAHIKDNTITSTMYAIVWDASQSAYTNAMASSSQRSSLLTRLSHNIQMFLHNDLRY